MFAFSKAVFRHVSKENPVLGWRISVYVFNSADANNRVCSASDAKQPRANESVEFLDDQVTEGVNIGDWS